MGPRQAQESGKGGLLHLLTDTSTEHELSLAPSEPYSSKKLTVPLLCAPFGNPHKIERSADFICNLRDV